LSIINVNPLATARGTVFTVADGHEPPLNVSQYIHRERLKYDVKASK